MRSVLDIAVQVDWSDGPGWHYENELYETGHSLPAQRRQIALHVWRLLVTLTIPGHLEQQPGEIDEIPDKVNRNRHGYWDIDNVDSAVGAELLCLHGEKPTVTRGLGGYMLFDPSGKMLGHGMSAMMLVGALDAFGVLPRSEHEKARQ